MTKTNNIIVTGDDIRISNIIQLPRISSLYGRTFEDNEKGGANHLHSLIKEMLKEDKDIQVNKIDLNFSIYSKLILLWTLHEEVLSSDISNTWRINTIIGKEKKTNPRFSLERFNNQILASLDRTISLFNNDPYSLVFTDQHLNSESVYSQLVKTSEKPSDDNAFKSLFTNDQVKKIYFKTSLSDNLNELARFICDNSFSSKVTIIVDAESLRKKNIHLHAKSSWNSTYSSLRQNLTHGTLKYLISKTQRMIVYFKYAGFALIDNSDLKKPTIDLFFDPEKLENTWEAKYPGVTGGDLEIITSNIIHCDLYGYSEFLAFKNSLQIARTKHILGRGKYKKDEEKGGYNSNIIQEQLLNTLKKFTDNMFQVQNLLPFVGKMKQDLSCPEKPETLKIKVNDLPVEESKFYQTIDDKHYELINHSLKTPPLTLLEMYIGSSYERIVQKGAQIIENGYSFELDSIPFLRISELVTYDQQEIENINLIKELMRSYVDSNTSRPLAFVVLGPPGTGKSFYIKNIAKDVGTNFSLIEVNLSQLEEANDLTEVIGKLQNISIQKQIPLVIWDEFDTGNFKWLRLFLEPLQDGYFSMKGQRHIFGKSIFVFCGSAFSSYLEFVNAVQSLPANDQSIPSYDRLGIEIKPANTTNNKIDKGSDFISRIKAYLDIQSLNAEIPTSHGLSIPCSHNYFTNNSYIIRRAILFRNYIERFYPDLINNNTKKARICPSISHAFLRSERFFYEARSIENILHLCNLQKKRHFTVSDIPPYKLIKNNVSEDFYEYIEKYQTKYYEIDKLIKELHKKWLSQKMEEFKHEKNRILCPIHLEDNQTIYHPAMISNPDHLSTEITIANNRAVGTLLANISDLGVLLSKSKSFKSNEVKKYLGYTLANLEHESWLDERIKIGWKNNPNSDNPKIIVNQTRLIDHRIRSFSKLCDKRKKEYLERNLHLLDVIEKMEYNFTLGYDLGYKLRIGILYSDDIYLQYMIKYDVFSLILSFLKTNYKYEIAELSFCPKHINASKLIQKLDSWNRSQCSNALSEKLIIPNVSVHCSVENKECYCEKSINKSYNPNPVCNSPLCHHVLSTSNVLFWHSKDLIITKHIEANSASDMENFFVKPLSTPSAGKEKIPSKHLKYNELFDYSFFPKAKIPLSIGVKLYDNTLYMLNRS
ncbi:MAG TPA: AAA family ATPase [Caldisericia bacterium]|nr:AAA family ATPase [Caldisericia bacterium]